MNSIKDQKFLKVLPNTAKVIYSWGSTALVNEQFSSLGVRCTSWSVVVVNNLNFEFILDNLWMEWKMVRMFLMRCWPCVDTKLCKYVKKKMMWHDCQWDNSPQVTKMTQKLTTVSHRTAFNNEQSPYRIVSYKRPRNNDVKREN